MVMTILEARVAPEKQGALEAAYKAGTEHKPPQLAQTFLILCTVRIPPLRYVASE